MFRKSGFLVHLDAGVEPVEELFHAEGGFVGFGAGLVALDTNERENFLGGTLFFDLSYLEENGNSQKQDE